MKTFEEISFHINKSPRMWLITSCAGFIGSNLLQKLLELNQTVRGLDNFSTGSQHNLDQVKALVGEKNGIILPLLKEI